MKLQSLTTNPNFEEELAAYLAKPNVCPSCGGVEGSWATLCHTCETEKEREDKNKKLQDYLEKVSQNSLEIRMRNIEEWIYNHEQNHPMVETRMV